MALPRPDQPCHEMATYALAVPGFIKVGRTTHILRRIKALQTGSPHRIEIVGYIAGDHERRMHEMLIRNGATRAEGEWFVDCPRVRATLWNLGFTETQPNLEAAPWKWEPTYS